MIQLVWLTIGFQIFIWLTLSYKHTEFMKVIRTDDSAFKSSSKMIQEQAAATVTIALISEKNKLRKNRKKKSVWNLGLKEEITLRVLWNSACRTAVRIQI